MSDKPNQASSVDEMLGKLGTYAFAEELVCLTAAVHSMRLEIAEQKEVSNERQARQYSSVDEMLRGLGHDELADQMQLDEPWRTLVVEVFSMRAELEEQKKAFNRLSEQMVFLTAASASMQIEFHEQKEAFQKVLDMLSPEVRRTTRVLE